MYNDVSRFDKVWWGKGTQVQWVGDHFFSPRLHIQFQENVLQQWTRILDIIVYELLYLSCLSVLGVSRGIVNLDFDLTDIIGPTSISRTTPDRHHVAKS